METRDQIIEYMARTFYTCAYADFIERAFEDGVDVSDMPQAGGGQDWMDHAPETSESARALARNLAKSIEELNGASLDALYERVSEVCEESDRCRLDRHNEDEFGFCLAMEAMGHGVGWSDNHPDHGLRVPHADFHIHDRDDLEGEAEGIDPRFC